MEGRECACGFDCHKCHECHQYECECACDDRDIPGMTEENDDW